MIPVIKIGPLHFCLFDYNNLAFTPEPDQEMNDTKTSTPKNEKNTHFRTDSLPEVYSGVSRPFQQREEDLLLIVEAQPNIISKHKLSKGKEAATLLRLCPEETF
jgi:hypothetical protein